MFIDNNTNIGLVILFTSDAAVFRSRNEKLIFQSIPHNRVSIFGTSLRRPRLAKDPANLLSLLGMTDRNDFLRNLSDAERRSIG